MSNLIHGILNWTEDKTIELDGTKKSDYAKAFGLGCIEGLIDGAVIVGTIGIVKGWIDIIFKKNKRKWLSFSKNYN